MIAITTNNSINVNAERLFMAVPLLVTFPPHAKYDERMHPRRKVYQGGSRKAIVFDIRELFTCLQDLNNADASLTGMHKSQHGQCELDSHTNYFIMQS
jgi:hypothetical protein